MQTYNRGGRSIIRKVGTDRRRLRRSNMARGLVVLAVMVILTATLPSSAGELEETQLGQLCWRFDPPFTDTLRVSIALLPAATATDAVLFEVFARWRATASAIGQAVGGPGPVTYQLLGAGTLALENVQPPATPAFANLGFEAVQNIIPSQQTPPQQTPPAFGGNLSCNFSARLSLASLSGPWLVQCFGTTTPYTRTGNLTFLTCPDAEF